ncbi:hypothetical protein CC79DRAFT_1324548 [Sarocladium strictum]
MALIATSLLLALASAEQNLHSRELSFHNSTTNDKFEEFLESTNASAAVDITVPNLHTNAYPAESQQVRWWAWLGITEKDANGGLVDGGLYPDARYISENGSVEVDDSWLTCVSLTRFYDPGLSLDEDVESDCSNVFSDECLEFLEQLSDDGRLCANSTMREQWEDSPCSGELNGKHTKSVLEPYDVFHPTHLNNFTQVASSVNDDGPDNRYDAFVKSVYLFAVGFARLGDEEVNARGKTVWEIDEDADRVRSQFVCLRPDQFSEGSRTLEDIEDAGGRMGVSVGAVVGLASFAVAMTAGLL